MEPTMKKILLGVLLTSISLSSWSWDCTQGSYVNAQDRNTGIDNQRNELEVKVTTMNEAIDMLITESQKEEPSKVALCGNIITVQEYQKKIFEGRNDVQNQLFEMSNIWDQISDECAKIGSVQNGGKARAYYFNTKDMATNYKENEQQRKNAYNGRAQSLDKSANELNCL